MLSCRSALVRSHTLQSSTQPLSDQHQPYVRRDGDAASDVAIEAGTRPASARPPPPQLHDTSIAIHVEPSRPTPLSARFNSRGAFFVTLILGLSEIVLSVFNAVSAGAFDLKSLGSDVRLYVFATSATMEVLGFFVTGFCHEDFWKWQAFTFGEPLVALTVGLLKPCKTLKHVGLLGVGVQAFVVCSFGLVLLYSISETGFAGVRLFCGMILIGSVIAVHRNPGHSNSIKAVFDAVTVALAVMIELAEVTFVLTDDFDTGGCFLAAVDFFVIIPSVLWALKRFLWTLKGFVSRIKACVTDRVCPCLKWIQPTRTAMRQESIGFSREDDNVDRQNNSRV